MKAVKINTETSSKPRLGRADWLRAALVCLIDDGIDAVQVTRLASALGATRGSFYWHFKSRQDLLDGLLEEWLAVNGNPIKQVLGDATGLDRGILSFFALWADPVKFSSPLEQAVRDWARLDDTVLEIVRGEDAKRVTVIAEFYQRFDYQPLDAVVRARVLYFAQVGYFAMNVEEAMEERMSMLEAYFLAFTGRSLDAAVAEMFRADWSLFT